MITPRRGPQKIGRVRARHPAGAGGHRGGRLAEAAGCPGGRGADRQGPQPDRGGHHRRAELRTAVLGALKTEDYDGLTVGEISERLEGLSAEQLRKVREFEKRNKGRETLVGQIDRKIRANNNS